EGEGGERGGGGGGGGAGGGGAGAGGQAAAGVGGAAAGGGEGPRDRAAAPGFPDGRAAVQPRRQAAGADEGRDRPAAALARGDHDLRHPRPDRGDDPGQPGGGDPARGAAAGGAAAGALPAPGQPVRGLVHRLTGHEPDRG